MVVNLGAKLNGLAPFFYYGQDGHNVAGAGRAGATGQDGHNVAGAGRAGATGQDGHNVAGAGRAGATGQALAIAPAKQYL
jgi:hypothetical protein